MSDDDDQSSIRDAGELEIEDIDEFRPDTITPAQAEVLQPRSPIRTHSHARTIVDDNVLIHYALTQMTMRQGINKHGEAGKDKMVAELTQLHDREVFCPVNKADLSEEQKQEAMRLLMFLKEKIDDSLKGRACADGRKQHGKYEKADTTSPTVAHSNLY